MIVKKNLKIELLYFAECPSWKNALDLLTTVIDEIGLDAEVDLIRVETQDEANIYQFVGSPTFRINGRDLFPSNQDHYALGCRVYPTSAGLKGWPTEEMLKEKISTRNSPEKTALA